MLKIMRRVDNPAFRPSFYRFELSESFFKGQKGLGFTLYLMVG